MDWTTLASIYTITAFYVAWLAFFVERRSRLEQKKSDKIDILKSIKQELRLMNHWLGGSYDDNNYITLQDPWHPFHMVYGLIRNDAIKSALSIKSVSLLSEALLDALVLLNQQLGSFEQHVNRLIQFNTSNPIIATKAFYYYDRIFAKYTRPQKWLEFEKLSRKLSSGVKLNEEQIHLIGSVRILKDLHVMGIGSENTQNSLRDAHLKASTIVDEELGVIDKEKQFKENPLFIFLDTVVFGSIFLGTILAFFTILKGGDIMSYFILGIITIISIALGFIKYGSIATAYEGKAWQLKFVEIWNDIINFLLSGLVAYYFMLVRVPKLLKGELPQVIDFVLFSIFALGAFGHLCVLSKNITDGVAAILKRVLEK